MTKATDQKPVDASQLTGGTITELLHHADARESAPDATKQRIKSQLKAQWRQKNSQRKKRNIWLASGTFASALSVFMLMIFNGQMFSDNQVTNNVMLARVQGDVKTSFSSSRDESLQGNNINNTMDLKTLPVGTMIETLSDGLATLTLHTGGDLRLHHNSQLIVNSHNEFTLSFGTVYFDSGKGDLTIAGSRMADLDKQKPSLSAITIKTLHGNIQDIGTQFQVSSNTSTLQVSVREGLINLHNEQGKKVVNQGFKLTEQSNGSFEEVAISPQDQSWQWVNDAAPSFNLEGKNLHQFLVWISREHGLVLHFNQKHTEKLSKFIILHGDINGLDLEQALNTVFATTELSYRIEHNKLKVIR